MRSSPLTPMLLKHLDCFSPEEIEKIINMEPYGYGHEKSPFGAMLGSEQDDSRDLNKF